MTVIGVSEGISRSSGYSSYEVYGALEIAMK